MANAIDGFDFNDFFLWALIRLLTDFLSVGTQIGIKFSVNDGWCLH